MLTEFALRSPKPRTAPYKIADRDGMYVAVSPAGTISFRYDYRINGRRETLTIDRYGRDGIWLALVREKLLDARRAVREGKSPAVEKQRQKQRRALAKTFGEWAASWLDGARMADTTRSVRKGIVARDVLPAFTGGCSARSPLILRLILLTMVRKSELIEATWDEVDFEASVWTIPKSRIKARRSHNVYLSRQSIATMVALHTCAAGSRNVLPSRYAADRCVSKATLNRGMQIVAERAKTAGLPLEPFTVHDLGRTGSTLLSEAGFNSDWIEKSLAHGRDGRYSRAVYNKAEYAVQRRHMLQEWVDMVDAWVRGGGYRLNLLPSDMGISPRGLPLDS